MHNLDAYRAKRILIAQVVTTLVVTLVGLIFSPREALFALIGGAIALAGSVLFAYWVFGRYRASEPGRLVGQFYAGEVLKLGFIVLAFAAVIVTFDQLSPLALFGAFLVVQVLPLLLANRIAR